MYQRYRNIHLIVARGTWEDRVRTQVQFLKQLLRESALPIIGHKNEWLLRRAPGFLRSPWVHKPLVWAYKNGFVPWMYRRTTRDYKTVVEMLSREGNLPFNLCRESHCQPDGYLFMARFSMKHGLGHLPFDGMMGCTSAVTLSNWTESGRLLMCRNMDYPIVGPWESNPLVTFHEPEEKDRIPHVSVSSAGVITSSISAMNREGLSLALHVHFGKKFSLLGKPIFPLGNSIIEKAKKLSEAVDLARKYPLAGNWSFVIASARENDAIVIEMSPGKVCVRNAKDGFIAHSNFFHSPELRRNESLISGSYRDDLISRLTRIRDILEPDRGQLRPSHMAAALGDHIDPITNEHRVFGNTVSVTTTIQSLIFEPGSQRVWVSTREESPTGLGDYVELNAETYPKGAGDPRDLTLLENPRTNIPGLLEGIRFYRKAFQTWHVYNREPDYAEKTLVWLGKSVEAFPSDGNVWLQLGFLLFKMKRLAEARQIFERALRLKLSPHHRDVGQLFLARCFDVEGNRLRALELYRTGASVQEPRLRKAFRNGLKQIYNVSRTKDLLVDLHFPDPIFYS